MDATYESLRLDVDPARRIAVVTLDRPPVNAIARTTIRELRDVFASFDDRRDVNCVVLTAAGRTFCAGIDLRDRSSGEERPLDPGRKWREAKETLFNCAVPVIGAVNGVAIGAGIGLTAACDILIASDRARFGVTEMNVGLLGGGSALLRMVGPFKMRSMFFTAELASAEEMYRLGAVERIVPHDELLPAATALAASIAAKSPIGLRLAKESLNRMEELVNPWADAYRMEQDYTNRLGIFEDSREGTQAFLERREPHWKWR